MIRMAIDGKEIGMILWKILGFSLNMTLEFTRNYPIFSGVSMGLLALYIFLPSVFYILIYSTPILACVGVYVIQKLNPKGQKSQNTEENPSSCREVEEKGSVGERSNARSHLIHQRSVRRNARMKVEKWESAQTSGDDDDKDKVILTSLYNDLLGRTPHFEESPKAIETCDVLDNGSDSSEHPESSDLSYPNVDDIHGATMAASSYEITGIENDQAPRGKEDRTEQKSSGSEATRSLEVEWNQRLASLLARRRAKRSFKIASSDEKYTINGDEQVSPTQKALQISVPNKNGSLRRNHRENGSEECSDLQIPCSAPSVLLPSRNPFDIPYDPQEERPVLKGDSFDLEFSVFNPKDLPSSLHESFSRSQLFSSDPASDMKSLEGNGNENRDEEEDPREGEKALMAAKTTQEKDESIKSGNGVEKASEETDSDKERNSDSSSSEESESEFSCLSKSDLRDAIRQSMGDFNGLFVNQARNLIPSPLPRGIPPRLDDHHLFYAGRCSNPHTRTFSIASDLQVEFSEIGSPPTTVDWHEDGSSNGGESYIYDTDIDREIACGEEFRKKQKSDMKSNCSESRTSSSDLVLTYELDREDQSKQHMKQVAEEVTDHTLFHASVSLYSIAEEPETVVDPIDVEHQDKVKQVVEELSDLSSLKQMKNEEIRGTSKKIDVETNTEESKEEGEQECKSEIDRNLRQIEKGNTSDGDVCSGDIGYESIGRSEQEEGVKDQVLQSEECTDGLEPEGLVEPSEQSSTFNISGHSLELLKDEISMSETNSPEVDQNLKPFEESGGFKEEEVELQSDVFQNSDTASEEDADEVKKGAEAMNTEEEEEDQIRQMKTGDQRKLEAQESEQEGEE